jgi:hypothetical protein
MFLARYDGSCDGDRSVRSVLGRNWRQSNREAVGNMCDVGQAQWPRFGDHLGQILGPGDPHPTMLKGAVALCEARLRRRSGRPVSWSDQIAVASSSKAAASRSFGEASTPSS